MLHVVNSVMRLRRSGIFFNFCSTLSHLHLITVRVGVLLVPGAFLFFIGQGLDSHEIDACQVKSNTVLNNYTRPLMIQIQQSGFGSGFFFFFFFIVTSHGVFSWWNLVSSTVS